MEGGGSLFNHSWVVAVNKSECMLRNPYVYDSRVDIFYASNNGHDLLGQFLCKYGDDMYIIYGSK